MAAFQHAFALRAEFLGKLVFQRTADHGLDQLVVGHVGHVLGEDVLAIAHDRHPVAQLEQLLQLVGDKQYGDALALELANRGHQLLDLLLAQGGRGLVHDQQLGVQRDRLGDLHHLLQAHAQLAALDVGVHLGMTQRGQRLVRLPVHAGIVQQPARLGDLAAHEHVVHHRQHRHDVQLLIHAGDAGFARLYRV